MPPVAFDSTKYEYHTFGAEILPYEIRFLFDSNVVRRIPDRLIPIGQNQYDLAATFERSPQEIMIAESGWDLAGNDWNGTDSVLNGDGTYRSWTYAARKYFEAHNTDRDHGCWDVTIDGKTYHAAHDRVDYVKVWDVPFDQKISGFPQ